MLRELQGSGSSFAQTGHAMRLLEGVGVALQHLEPALLVGETGTGKTTLVQRLADQVHTCLQHAALPAPRQWRCIFPFLHVEVSVRSWLFGKETARIAAAPAYHTREQQQVLLLLL